MNHSGIEWTDDTWNPVTGCSKVSQACKNCYAERLWPKVSAAEAKRTGQPIRAFTSIRTHPDRLEQPLRMRKPRRIFVNSMSDLFHEDVPDRFIDHVFAVMAAAPQHTFQILTKRPSNALAWFNSFRIKTQDASGYGGAAIYLHEALKSGIGYHHTHRRAINCTQWPLHNVWLGVSVEDQATADERIPLLLQTPAAVRFISAEPLLGPIDLQDYLMCLCGKCGGDAPLHLVIAGGESGPQARPSHPDWYRSLRDQCAYYSVNFFFKQWGEWVPSDSFMVRSQEDYNLPAKRSVHKFLPPHNGAMAFKVGKKAAGRLLDGREHSELPK